MGCQINTERNLDAAEELSTVTVRGLPNKHCTKFRYARVAIHGYVGCQINTVRNLDLEEGAINE